MKAIARIKRCEGITSANVQCKCWATQRVNEIPYCDQHAAKVLREAAAYKGPQQLKRQL